LARESGEARPSQVERTAVEERARAPAQLRFEHYLGSRLFGSGVPFSTS
jgi:hypothetical protein